MKIEHHPAIERELREIVAHYNSFAESLGDEFLNEFDHQITRISAMPYRWVAIKEDIRRSLMRRFPYVIYFRIVSEDVIRVTVVKHQRRHPNMGAGRK